MKRVYICHPFSDDPVFNRQRVNEICKNIIRNEKDVLPISPIHLFGFIDEETAPLREEIMKVCYELIDDLDFDKDEKDEVRVYIYDNSRSKGQADEVNYVLEKISNIKHINGDLL